MNSKLRLVTHHLLSVVGASLLVLNMAQAQTEQYNGPIIDMHWHGYSQEEYSKRNGGTTNPANGTKSPTNNQAHQQALIDLMDQYQIEYAMLSATLEGHAAWEGLDKRIIPGFEDDYFPEIEKFEQLIKEGTIQVFGELQAVYHGTSLADSIYAPYLTLCEQYDIPVAVHTGTSRPGLASSCCPNYRIPKGSPYELEEVLIRYPNLRLYMMHAGAEFNRDAIMLMYQYRQVYADLGALLWIEPLTQQFAIEFLQLAKTAGFLDRVMFGSDPMTWPEAIPQSIEFLNSLAFLTKAEKEMIFYTNAKNFLKQ